jgi:hypothetical protein
MADGELVVAVPSAEVFGCVLCRVAPESACGNPAFDQRQAKGWPVVRFMPGYKVDACESMCGLRV